MEKKTIKALYFLIGFTFIFLFAVFINIGIGLMLQSLYITNTGIVFMYIFQIFRKENLS